MELHQVRYFLAVASTLNFTRAAEQCNVTQPALTKGVQKLEQELGGQLIYRERLLTQIRPSIEQQTHPGHLQQRRCPQPLVARIGRCADRAAAADHRDAHGCAGSKKCEAHSYKLQVCILQVHT